MTRYEFDTWLLGALAAAPSQTRHFVERVRAKFEKLDAVPPPALPEGTRHVHVAETLPCAVKVYDHDGNGYRLFTKDQTVLDVLEALQGEAARANAQIDQREADREADARAEAEEQDLRRLAEALPDSAIEAEASDEVEPVMTQGYFGFSMGVGRIERAATAFAGFDPGGGVVTEYCCRPGTSLRAAANTCGGCGVDLRQRKHQPWCPTLSAEEARLADILKPRAHARGWPAR